MAMAVLRSAGREARAAVPTATSPRVAWFSTSHTQTSSSALRFSSACEQFSSTRSFSNWPSV